MDEWLRSKCTQDSQKSFLSLPDNAKIIHSAKIKICTLSTPSLTTSSTQNTSENKMHAFVLGPLQFQSTDQNTHLTSKMATWLSRKI